MKEKLEIGGLYKDPLFKFYYIITGIFYYPEKNEPLAYYCFKLKNGTILNGERIIFDKGSLVQDLIRIDE